MKLMARVAVCGYCLAVTGLVMLFLFIGGVLALWQRTVTSWLEHAWFYAGEVLKGMESHADRVRKS